MALCRNRRLALWLAYQARLARVREAAAQRQQHHGVPLILPAPVALPLINRKSTPTTSALTFTLTLTLTLTLLSLDLPKTCSAIARPCPPCLSSAHTRHTPAHGSRPDTHRLTRHSARIPAVALHCAALHCPPCPPCPPWSMIPLRPSSSAPRATPPTPSRAALCPWESHRPK
jgi:hypothetical protein